MYIYIQYTYYIILIWWYRYTMISSSPFFLKLKNSCVSRENLSAAPRSSLPVAGRSLWRSCSRWGQRRSKQMPRAMAWWCARPGHQIGDKNQSRYLAMDQYLLIPFLGGWTSIYQLFWCSPGVQGFDTLPFIIPVAEVISIPFGAWQKKKDLI